MKNEGPLAQARAALAGLVNTLSTGVKCPEKADVNAAHRRAHRMGRPAKIAADSDLQACVTARLDTLTFDQTAYEVAATFAPPHRVNRSSIHRWWQKTRTN